MSTDPFTFGILLKSGYWPGNISSINYLFDEEVFLLWDKFRKYMPGSSERAFLRSINAISEENGRVCAIIHSLLILLLSSIENCLFSRSFFCYFYFQLCNLERCHRPIIIQLRVQRMELLDARER